MSTIKTNTLTGTTSAGSIVVTGEGGSTTTNLQQGLAKVWGNFGPNGTAVRDSTNVSSLTDTSAGRYKPNFTNNMGNTNYAPTTFAHEDNYHTMRGQVDNDLSTDHYDMPGAYLNGSNSSYSFSIGDVTDYYLSIDGDLA